MNAKDILRGETMKLTRVQIAYAYGMIEAYAKVLQTIFIGGVGSQDRWLKERISEIMTVLKNKSGLYNRAKKEGERP